MSRQRKPSLSKLEDGAQITWEFDDQTSTRADDALPKYAATPRAMLFDDPDPRRLFVGPQRLERYLRKHKLHRILELRNLLATINWEPFEAAYQPGGRPPFHPRTMVGLVLFGLTEGHCSLRQLELLAATDVRAWWITGGLLPDHSAIGNFLTRHQELLTTTFFEELTREILKRTGSDCSCVASDGTVIESVSSRMHKLLKSCHALFTSWNFQARCREAEQRAATLGLDEATDGKARDVPRR